MDEFNPVIMSCPSDIFTNIEIEFGSAEIPVSWSEPSAVDESGNVTLLVKTNSPGDRFGIGTSTVTYLFADPSNNMASCEFKITVQSSEYFESIKQQILSRYDLPSR